MALSADDLAIIDAALGAPDATADAIAVLRQRLAPLWLTRCDPEDFADETPFRHYARFDLHLVDGSHHCWRITDDPAMASGLVVTPRKAAA